MTTTLNATTSNGLVVTPDNSGNVLLQYNGVSTPAFSAIKTSNQTLNATTETKITFDTEQFDTANCFASSRFTPTVAGYYQITGTLSFTNSATGYCNVWIYKNGSRFSRPTQLQLVNTTYNGFPFSYLVYMNGSTDYLEIYSTTANDSVVYGDATTSFTFFQGCLLRGA
jgi:hypothetical protein